MEGQYSYPVPRREVQKANTGLAHPRIDAAQRMASQAVAAALRVLGSNNAPKAYRFRTK